jgi:hypothetical protein
MLGVVTSGVALLQNVPAAGGIFFGAALSWLSFYWLVSAMAGLSQTVAGDETKKPSARRLFVRFILRYALVAAALYAMIKSSLVVTYAIGFGLLLIVPALMIEAIYLLVQVKRLRV